MKIEKKLYLAAEENEGKTVEAVFRALGWSVERACPDRLSQYSAVVLGHGKHLDGSEFAGGLCVRSLDEYDEASVIRDILEAYKARLRLVVVRGAGDLATGTIIRLHNAGYRVIATEIDKPTVIRRTVSFAEAVYEGAVDIEGVSGRLVSSLDEAYSVLDNGSVPILIDPGLSLLGKVRPTILVDAAIAKRNLGTRIDMAPFVVALGPGFTAGLDADAVIETKRGHYLGSVICAGSAIPNTGIPGVIAGYASERVIHSPSSGVFNACSSIGDIVRKGDVIARVGSVEVRATIDGKLRGLLHDGLAVPEGFKIADIDPRDADADHLTVSDKARAIAGGVLEAVDAFIAAGN